MREACLTAVHCQTPIVKALSCDRYFCIYFWGFCAVGAGTSQALDSVGVFRAGAALVPVVLRLEERSEPSIVCQGCGGGCVGEVERDAAQRCHGVHRRHLRYRRDRGFDPWSGRKISPSRFRPGRQSENAGARRRRVRCGRFWLGAAALRVADLLSDQAVLCAAHGRSAKTRTRLPVGRRGLAAPFRAWRARIRPNLDAGRCADRHEPRLAARVRAIQRPVGRRRRPEFCK